MILVAVAETGGQVSLPNSGPVFGTAGTQMVAEVARGRVAGGRHNHLVRIAKVEYVLGRHRAFVSPERAPGFGIELDQK